MNNDKKTLTQMLQEYSQSGACPMHMPGHKRQLVEGGVLPLQLDITEINGFDNLHHPEGVLKQSMEQAAALYGADHSFYLVNGSSGGILAGICAATKPQDKILLARGCHKSVYHGLELRQLNPVYLLPPVDPSFGIAQSISPKEVEQQLQQHPDTALVLITSPTYEGVISDIASIADICHKRNIPLMVDEAHGAHLGFSPEFVGGAVKAGADVVIQSLHKTLPSPTQTAIAHLNGTLVSQQEFSRQLAIFQTSSPSYLLMSGVESCINLLQQQKESLFKQYTQRLQQFSDKIVPLQHLRVLGYGQDRLEQHSGFFAFDKGKLVLSTRGTNITGTQLKDRLREEYSIELEMAMGDYALAMTSVSDTSEMMQRLADALLQLDKQLYPQPYQLLPDVSLPPIAVPLYQARWIPTEEIPLEDAQNRICAENIWAYPPGIPLITAGEQINQSLLQTISTLLKQGVELYGESEEVPQKIRVVQHTANCGKGSKSY